MHQRAILIVSKLVSWLDITLCVAELIWISVFRRKGTLFDLCSSNNTTSSNNNFALLLFGVSVQDLWSIGVKYRDVYGFLMWKGGFLAEGEKKNLCEIKGSCWGLTSKMDTETHFSNSACCYFLYSSCSSCSFGQWCSWWPGRNNKRTISPSGNAAASAPASAAAYQQPGLQLVLWQQLSQQQFPEQLPLLSGLCPACQHLPGVWEQQLSRCHAGVGAGRLWNSR